MNDNPCFGCIPPKRNADCHSICKEYTDWKRDHDAELDEQRKQKLQEWGRIEIRESSIRKAKRKPRRRRS